MIGGRGTLKGQNPGDRRIRVERLSHNQTTNRLRRALIGRADTVVAAVPYRR